MLYIRRITGNSMYPTLRDGDYIWALRRLRGHYRQGDIVLVDHPKYAKIVKRIQSIDSNGLFWLTGDGIESVSSTEMGPINHRQILAKMFWHICPKDHKQ